MRSENLIEYSIKMRVESIISVTEKSDYYAIISANTKISNLFRIKFEYEKNRFVFCENGKSEKNILSHCLTF